MNTCDDRSYLVKYQLLERAVATDVNPYVYDNELGEPLQSAYRPLHSTETVMWLMGNTFQSINLPIFTRVHTAKQHNQKNDAG